MDLNELYNLLALCLEEMPKSYPKPAIIVHQSAEEMVRYLGDTPHSFQHTHKYPPSLVVGMACFGTSTIHIPYTVLYQDNKAEIVDTLLHEIGHLYYANKFGTDSKEADDETLAITFAKRWLNKLRSKIYKVT